MYLISKIHYQSLSQEYFCVAYQVFGYPNTQQQLG